MLNNQSQGGKQKQTNKQINQIKLKQINRTKPKQTKQGAIPWQ